MTDDRYRSTWSVPNAVLVDLRLHVFRERRRGVRLRSATVQEDGVRALLDAGGLPALRHRPNAELDLYVRDRSVGLSISLPHSHVVEIRRQILLEEEFGLWWTTGQVITVALHRHLHAKGVDILRATWDFEVQAAERLQELAASMRMDPSEVLEMLVLTS